jgi:hypothetical protein
MLIPIALLTSVLNLELSAIELLAFQGTDHQPFRECAIRCISLFMIDPTQLRRCSVPYVPPLIRTGFKGKTFTR